MILQAIQAFTSFVAQLTERRIAELLQETTTDLHNLYRSDVGPDVAVCIPPALNINDGEEFLLTSGDPAFQFAPGLQQDRVRFGTKSAEHYKQLRTWHRSCPRSRQQNLQDIR